VAAGGRSVARAAAALPDEVSGPIEYLKNNCGMHAMYGLFRRPTPRGSGNRYVTARAALGATLSFESIRERLRGFNLVELDPKKVTTAAIKRIEASRAIELAEPVPNRWIAAAAADPALNLQWGLRAINWFRARRPDAKAMKVAVLDTGVDRGHPDLRNAVKRYETVGKSRYDYPGHGTHVSGIIAAVTNNAVGITGAANCQIEMWKVFTDPGNTGRERFDERAYFQALEDVLDSDVKIINLSLGGTASSGTERSLFEVLISGGKLIVAAMGNEFEEGNLTSYPAAYPGVCAIGAVDELRRWASFSNTGRHISLVAPGVNILSTLPRYRHRLRGQEVDYAAWPGTSMATPYVSAAAALIWARYPAWTAKKVRARLTATAQKLPAMRGRASTPAYGHGLVDVRAAL
jgi:subtilisin family serine protease